MDSSLIIPFLIYVVLIIGIIVICRSITLWYLRINEQIEILQNIESGSTRQTALMQKQLEIMQLFLIRQGSKIRIRNNETGEESVIDFDKWQEYNKKRYIVIDWYEKGERTVE